jgi:hypothetical protein
MQETFDKIVRGLWAQGEKCIILGGGCAYRNDAGKKCAAGMLMLDEHYNEDLEGASVLSHHEMTMDAADRVRQALVLSGVHDDDWTWAMVSDCQCLHDSDTFEVHQWPDQFGDVAHRYELTFPPELVGKAPSEPEPDPNRKEARQVND